ncbi:MAG: ABC transporter permease [Lachnospirales bacterium]
MNMKLLKQEFKNNKKLFFLYTCLLLAVFFSIYIIYSSNQYDNYNSFFFPFLIISSIIYGVTLFSYTLIKFDYFHNKSKLDFYHGLPIKRKELFLTNFFLIIFMLSIPFLVLNGINYFIGVIYIQSLPEVSYHLSSFFFEMRFIILFIFFASLTLYSFLIFIGTLTGKTVYQIIIFLQILFMPFFFILLTLDIMQKFINKSVSFRIPFIAFIENLFVNLSYNFMIFAMCLFFTLLIILFTSLSVIFYKKYKSEYVNKFINNKVILNIYPVLTAFFTASILTSVFIYFINNNYTTSHFVYVIIFLVFAVLSYSIFTLFRSVTKKKFNVKSFIVLLVMSFVYMFIVYFDGLDLTNYIPKNEKITAVTIYNHIFTDEKDIDLVKQIHKILIENDNSKDYSGNDIATSDYDETLKSSNDSFYIYYDGKYGNLLSRIYTINTSNTEVYELLNQLFTSDRYKKDTIDALKTYPNITYISSSFLTYDNDISTYFDRFNYYYKDEYDPFDKAVNDELIDCLILDIENDNNFGYYTEKPLTLLKFSFDTYDSIPINCNYTNTLDYLNKAYQETYNTTDLLYDSFTIQYKYSNKFFDFLDYAKSKNYEYVDTRFFYDIYDKEPLSISLKDEQEKFVELISTNLYNTRYYDITFINAKDKALVYDNNLVLPEE